MYEIIKGRPLPERDKYGMRRMEIGDSFDFPEGDRPLIRSAMNYAKTAHGLHFSIRQVRDGVLGCWRVADPDDQTE